MTYKAMLGDPVTGQDVTAYLEKDSWSIDSTYGQRGSTAKFYLAEDIALNPTAWNVLVKPLQRFTVTDTALGQVLFAGVINDPRMGKDGPLYNRWELNCRDYTIYADNDIVFGDYTNKTLDFILKDLTAQNGGCGITTNHVQPGPQIPRVVINYLPLTEAWNRACQYASQGAIWGWRVDENLDLNTFNGLTQSPLPAPLFTDNQSLVDEVTTFGYLWDNFNYEWDGMSVRNRIRVRGGNYTGPVTDSFVGNGQTSNFTLTYPVNSAVPSACTATVGGSNVPVTIDTGGSASSAVPAGQCLFTQAPSGQWFARFGTVPGNGVSVICKYEFLMPVVTQVDNPTSQAAYPGPNNGIYAMYLADPSITDVLTAKARGQREIAEYAFAEERLVFTSKDSNGFHIRAGDVITWSSSLIPDYTVGGDPIGITNGHYLVAQLHVEGVKGGYRRYNITGARVS